MRVAKRAERLRSSSIRCLLPLYRMDEIMCLRKLLIYSWLRILC